MVPAMVIGTPTPAEVEVLQFPPVAPAVQEEDFLPLVAREVEQPIFTLHPKNFIHMQQSVKAAVPLLP